MSTSGLSLLQDEEVVFEAEGAVLTNRRIFSNWGSRRGLKAPSEVNLIDVTGFKKITGGQESRHMPAIQLVSVGAVLLIVTLFEILPRGSKVEMALFLVGMLCVVVAMYLGVQTLFRVKPHTTIIFSVPEGEDMPIFFAGKDNPVADQFTHQFARTKRGI